MLGRSALGPSRADDEDALAVLRQTEMHCVEEPPLDRVIEIREGREDRGEMQPVFHRQEAFHVFEDETLGLPGLQDIDDDLE